MLVFKIDGMKILKKTFNKKVAVLEDGAEEVK